MVPVDGSHASLEAVAVGCDVSSRNKAKLYVVHVIEVKRTLPLDAELAPEEAASEEVLSQAVAVAREHDFDIEGEILQAREAGPAIVDEAIERGVDLLVLGMEYRQPFGEFQLGRVVEYVLKSAPCEVWVCRHPVQE